MKLLIILSLISISLLTGCKEILEDKEIKGILVTDKAAFGNQFLEFNDKESNLTRFIHPGKKIVQIKKSGLSNVEIKLMDSSRVQLGKIILKKDAYVGDSGNFFIKSLDMNQDWDIRGTTKSITLKKETYATRYSKKCQLKDCSGNSCEGLKGKVWFVEDKRNDFDIKFLVPNSNIVWGQFTAKGSLKTTAQTVDTKECRPKQVIVNIDKEIFQ